MPGSLFDFDLAARRRFGSIAGIDEAGRGPLAGPLFACAVALPPDADIPGVTDSKRLTDSRRRMLSEAILGTATAWGLGVVEPREIDAVGMSAAVRLSFERAAAAMGGDPGVFLVDGNPVKDLDLTCRFLVGGDGTSLSVAAASILAKVFRDDEMIRIHGDYPDYGFDRNKGYGTPGHLRAIRRCGPCPVHRMSFSPLREAGGAGQLELPLGPGGPGPAPWNLAEDFVAGHLAGEGWRIEARNVRWAGGEVDIVASRGGTVAFVEVKLAGPCSTEMQLEKMDGARAARMVSSALRWIESTGTAGGFRFDFALVTGVPGHFELRYFEDAITPGDGYLI